MPGVVTVTLTGDEKRALDAIQKVQDAERRLAAQGVEGGRRMAEGAGKAAAALGGIKGAATEAGNAVAGVFGVSSLKNLTAFAVGLAAVKAAYDSVANVAERLDRSREASAKRLESEAGSLAKLAQVSGGSPRRVAALEAQARSLFAAGGASSVDDAAGKVFTIAQAGVVDSQDSLPRLGRLGIGAQALVSAHALQQSLGASETGGLPQIVGKALRVSRPGEVEGFLAAAAKNGTLARQIGLSDEQLLAAQSLAADATGSTETGGAATKALLEAFAKKGLKGDFLANARKLATRSPRALEKFLGSSEPVSALRAITSDAEAFRSRVAELGAERDTLGQLDRVAQSTPGVRAVLAKRRQEADEQERQRDEGLARASRQEREASFRNELRSRGFTEGGVQAAQSGLEVMNWAQQMTDAAVGITELVDLLKDIREVVRATDQRRAAGRSLVSPDEDR